MQPSSLKQIGQTQPFCVLSKPSSPMTSRGEKLIRSINAESIKDITKRIIQEVIKKLKMELIQMEPGTGGIHAFTLSCTFDKDNNLPKLEEYLSSKITTLLECSFSTPSEFLNEGLKIPLFECELDKIGLLDMVYDESLANLLIHKKKNLNLKTLTIELKAELSQNINGDLQLQISQQMSQT